VTALFVNRSALPYAREVKGFAKLECG